MNSRIFTSRKTYMTHWVILTFLSLVFIFSACKTNKGIVDETPVEPGSEFNLENALLWEITGQGNMQTSYLFGTIHIIAQEDFFFPEGTLTALDQSEKIVFEINMEEMTDLASQMSLLKDAFMKDGLSLRDLLTDEDYDMVKLHFEEKGLPLFLFEKLKPMFLTIFSSNDMNPQDFQSGKIKSYEMEFMKLADQNHKSVGGLESIEYQMGIFDSIPYQVQADMLVESILANNTEGDQFKEMTEMYTAQDLNAMQEMFANEEGGLEGYEDLLVTNRNKNWIPIMEKMMYETPVFFAVGAGHLGGKEGVIHLLRNAGFKVEPYRKKQL